ncbi:hypothetical protein C8N46_101594 [Kordia periserrulae]|uniref:Uncharacterized protein n=1 Tax=Kordia periserrulae TaxID=701523 RepID=A0A2T6C6N1_9FLAO|nr:hypothetical protein [Kordia periserrulae]PTX63984.1 hypothetical protein C8N46_101594 [Kordia periserrulae]
MKKRYVSVYFTDVAKPIMEYQFGIKENDSVIKYTYKNLKNDKKDLEFLYDKSSKDLIFIFDKFTSLNSPVYLNKQIYKEGFTTYRSDNYSKILYHRQYGVLGITHLEGPHFVFLPELNIELANEVFYQLTK